MSEQAMPERVQRSELLSAFNELDREMAEALAENREEDARSAARLLLDFEHLPLRIYGRACLVLACVHKVDRLDMAQEDQIERDEIEIKPSHDWA
ncbi:hypothetical protein CKM354_000665600 [Cercospora kikuchii]|uniref:Uncharacterized protein n=1 Tax=Cercospora kikuchii TaxID=84275 RepID=A0A9P3FDL6_9PEZI|nr:uncharacterized protein CKM354_000665600 [Cercospora kikuchii]GIZ43428.1 hypothetical protein CKM354_000665600 [Cercospora kikuchii]